jgi:hypothetical protein
MKMSDKIARDRPSRVFTSDDLPLAEVYRNPLE